MQTQNSLYANMYSPWQNSFSISSSCSALQNPQTAPGLFFRTFHGDQRVDKADYEEGVVQKWFLDSRKTTLKLMTLIALRNRCRNLRTWYESITIIVASYRIIWLMLFSMTIKVFKNWINLFFGMRSGDFYH